MANQKDKANEIRLNLHINKLCNVSNKGEYSLQGFVMDSYERNNLEEVLYDLLERPDTSMDDMEKVIGVLFWLQGEKVLTDSPEQPQ